MRKKVLVVDDDVELSDGIAELLRDEGYAVKNTSDVFEGEKLINKEKFDIALLDYRMSGLNGIDLMKKIKSKNPATRVFLVTGRPFIEKIIDDEKVSHMVEDIVLKPFDDETLLRKIKESPLP